MKEFKLFDYQEDMKERIGKALRLHRSVMAQMPTGTGKTILLASVVESFLREHSNCNVWIVAHRRELVSQIRETIERVFLKITPSLFTLKEGNFSKTHPSSLTLKGGSTAFPKPLSPQGTGDVQTALLGAQTATLYGWRTIRGLRQQRSSVFCAGMNPLPLKDLLKGCLLVAFFENPPVLPLFPTFYHNECFSLVLLEAMEHGLPCISTTEGEYQELLMMVRRASSFRSMMLLCLLTRFSFS